MPAHWRNGDVILADWKWTGKDRYDKMALKQFFRRNCNAETFQSLSSTCGGFTAENVTLVDGAPKWVRGLSVNADGNIVLDVKPMGTIVIFR